MRHLLILNIAALSLFFGAVGAGAKDAEAVANCVDKANRTIKDTDKLEAAVRACQAGVSVSGDNHGYVTTTPGKDTLLLLNTNRN